MLQTNKVNELIELVYIRSDAEEGLIASCRSGGGLMANECCLTSFLVSANIQWRQLTTCRVWL